MLFVGSDVQKIIENLEENKTPENKENIVTDILSFNEYDLVTTDKIGIEHNLGGFGFNTNSDKFQNIGDKYKKLHSNKKRKVEENIIIQKRQSDYI